MGKSLSSCHLNKQRLINPLEAEVNESARLIESTGVTPPYKISRFHRESQHKNVMFSIRGPDGLDRLQREAPRSVGLWQRALYDCRLKEVDAVGVMVSTLTRDPAIEERRRNLST